MNRFLVALLAAIPLLSEASTFYPPAKAELRNLNGIPCVFADGEALPPMSFTAWWMHTMPDEYYRLLDEAGIRIHYVYSWTNWLKPGDEEKGELDGVQETVKRMKLVLRNSPSAWFIIRLMVSPPAEWIEENPSEQIRFTDGSPANTICTTVSRTKKVNMYSLCSEKWWSRADEAIEEFYRELSRHPEFSRVIGTFLCSAGTCEWYYPNLFRNPETRATGDCSAPFRRQHARYVKKRFGRTCEPKIPSFHEFDYIGDEHVRIVEALNGGKPYRRGENPAAFGNFLDVRNAPHAGEFFLALHDGTARTIVHFAETLKRIQPTLLVGAFYGSMAQTTYHDGGTASATLRILDSPAIDFLAAPPGYNNRQPGGCATGREMNDAFLIRNKIFISEDDDRTFKTFRAAHLPKGDDPVTESGFEGTMNMLRRDFGRNLCEGTRGWWFDMGRNGKFFYFDPGITRLFAEMQQIAKDAYARGYSKHNDIALVYDAESVQYASAIVNMNVLDYWRGLDLNRIGAPVDYHFSDDIANPKMPDYKLYVMVNQYVLDAAKREAIYAKARKNGATILWMYAPGLISTEGNPTLGAENVSAATGMKVSLFPDTRRPYFRMDGSDETHGKWSVDPLRKIESSEFGPKTVARPDEYLNPAFHINDPSAQTLGTYCDSGKPAIASKEVDGVRSIYCAVQTLPHSIIAKIAAEAGCHLYAKSGDVLYATDNIVTLHAREAGDRTITFKKPCSPYEVYLKRHDGRNVKSITVPFARGETKMWFLE